MNCGRNDRKNSATFGLSTLTTTPCVNERLALTPGWSGSIAAAGRISVRTPT